MLRSEKKLVRKSPQSSNEGAVNLLAIKCLMCRDLEPLKALLECSSVKATRFSWILLVV